MFLLGSGDSFRRKILRTVPKKVLVEMQREGWTIEPTGGGHAKWLHPSGAIVFSASTPSDRRAWDNHLAQMRRAKGRLGDHSMRARPRFRPPVRLGQYSTGRGAAQREMDAYFASQRGDVASASHKKCHDWDEYEGVCRDKSTSTSASASRESPREEAAARQRSADLSWDVATAVGAAWGAYMGGKYDHPYIGAAMGAAGPMLLHWIIEAVK